MKMSQMAIIVGGIGILAIILAFLIPYQESDVIEDTLDKETQSIDYDNYYESLPNEWNTSGPFKINQGEYGIGNKIFLVVNGLEFEEKGEIVIMRPFNATHHKVWDTIPFDGAKKSEFNFYFVPEISKINELCSVEDIIGKWFMVFRGTNYPNLDFFITERVVAGTNIESVC